MCLHTILLDPANADRIFVAISAAGAFRTDDGGRVLEADQQRAAAPSTSRTPTPRSATACTGIAMHPSRPGLLFMQKHWDVMRTDDAGENWREISGNLPTDFGFAIDVHAHEPETVYVVPIKSDAEHFLPERQARVYRSRNGGDEWEPLTKGLPQQNCYVNVLRDAMAVDTLDECGVYFGTTRRAGLRLRRRRRLVEGHRPRPAAGAVGRGADPAVIRIELPAPLRAFAGIRGEVTLEVSPPVTQRALLDALEARYPVLKGTVRDHATGRRRAYLRFFACEEDRSHDDPDAPLPDPVARGEEPFLVVGATSGG